MVLFMYKIKYCSTIKISYDYQCRKQLLLNNCFMLLCENHDTFFFFQNLWWIKLIPNFWMVLVCYLFKIKEIHAASISPACVWICQSYFRRMDVQTHTDRLVLLGWGSYLGAGQGCPLGGLLSRSNYSAWKEAINNPALLYCFNLSGLICVSSVSPLVSLIPSHTLKKRIQSAAHRLHIISVILPLRYPQGAN